MIDLVMFDPKRYWNKEYYENWINWRKKVLEIGCGLATAGINLPC